MRAYSLNSLKFALNKAGFETVAVWYFGMDIIELIRYIRNLNKNLKIQKLIKFYVLKLMNYRKFLMNLI